MLTRRLLMASLLASVLVASREAAAAAEPIRQTTTETSQGGTVVIVADIAASTSVVLDVISDVEGRVTDVRDLKRGELYLTGSDAFAAEYDLAILGMEHQFHIRYDVDRAAGVVTFGSIRRFATTSTGWTARTCCRPRRTGRGSRTRVRSKPGTSCPVSSGAGW
jgi:hypothetical protein